jgi:hypothetical protein
LVPAAVGELFRHYPAVAQQDEPVRQRRLARVVGHHEDGLLVLVHQAAQQVHDLGAVATVQVSRGLVRQQDEGVGDQGPGDCHALLFPA